MQNKLLLLLLLLSFGYGQAQENLEYQQPPQEILDLVDAPLAPAVQIDS